MRRRKRNGRKSLLRIEIRHFQLVIQASFESPILDFFLIPALPILGGLFALIVVLVYVATRPKQLE